MSAREIKFRAWDTESLKYRDQIPACEGWLDSDCWDDPEQYEEYLILSPESPLWHEDRFLYEQYIGLKDSKGREVYENDIVRLSMIKHRVQNAGPFVCSVWYDVNRFQFGFGKARVGSGDAPQFCFTPGYDHIDWSSFEVIGNIHESPNLLNS